MKRGGVRPPDVMPGGRPLASDTAVVYCLPVPLLQPPGLTPLGTVQVRLSVPVAPRVNVNATPCGSVAVITYAFGGTVAGVELTVTVMASLPVPVVNALTSVGSMVWIWKDLN